jgi:hypothetical protein
MVKSILDASEVLLLLLFLDLPYQQILASPCVNFIDSPMMVHPREKEKGVHLLPTFCPFLSWS